ncbi:MAG: hypothetical protein DRP78_07065 [Candidatus Omnitrophota bacterium]|nr:MAG: hypothetical protein DRP78_07065 [Candidatus Omnitrophota bacterium]
MPFLRLYQKFQSGLKWITRQRKAGINIEAQESRFKQTIAEPMDLAWKNLTREEQDDFIKKSRKDY